MGTKGTWHRPESKPGAYAEGWEAIFGKKKPSKSDPKSTEPNTNEDHEKGKLSRQGKVD